MSITLGALLCSLFLIDIINGMLDNYDPKELIEVRIE